MAKARWTPKICRQNYARIFEGEEASESPACATAGPVCVDPASTYIRKASSSLEEVTRTVPPLQDIEGARVLLMLGDIDYNGPRFRRRGLLPLSSPAGEYLIAHGISPERSSTLTGHGGANHEDDSGPSPTSRLRNMLSRPGRRADALPSRTGEVLTVCTKPPCAIRQKKRL